MRPIWLIARREFGAFIRSWFGYIFAAVYLALIGLFFNGFVLGGEEKLSAEVISGFFLVLSGGTLLIAVPLSFRLFAREQELKIAPLLLTSPVRDAQIVLGKFLGVFLFFGAVTLLTVYLPMLILVNGKVSMGHLVAGYLGVLLLGATCLSIGVFGSSVTRSQLVALVVAAVIEVPLVICWMLARKVDAPFNDFFSFMAIHNIHFTPFRTGVVHLRDVVFYLSMTTFFLFAATRMLESRRWR